MRRVFLAAAVLVTLALGTAPASASSVPGGWEPAPTPPYDVPAGARCDVPVHTEPVVDEVVQRVLERRPDGSPSRVAYRGDLVVRVTNTDSGAFYDADVSGSAIVDHHADGSQKWYVVGPVLAGVGENAGNLARGLYVLDGVYTMDISATGYKSVHLVRGSADDVCARIG
ncbi:hypothetical protein ACIRJR_14045 [Streptomyces sp. NPDC102402]|uniref:hypothetical protein n=1 Tax=Streptomyces sp. NPDC102402 TaxID=3366169 RepID=UPI00381CEA4C